MRYDPYGEEKHSIYKQNIYTYFQNIKSLSILSIHSRIFNYLRILFIGCEISEIISKLYAFKMIQLCFKRSIIICVTYQINAIAFSRAPVKLLLQLEQMFSFRLDRCFECLYVFTFL